MKILHIVSDWKWTGPAAPMLDLLRAQRARGDRADLACPEPPPAGVDGTEVAQRGLADAARAVGVTPALTLERYRNVVWWRDTRDARALARAVVAGEYDVVHTWHTRDHVLALRAVRERRRSRRTGLVRSLAGAERVAGAPWQRWLLGGKTDGLLCVSPAAAVRNAHLRPGQPIAGVLGSVDGAHFHPERRSAALRSRLGFSPEQLVIAVVARVQPHRRFDLLLTAVARLAEREPGLRLLVLGRGTAQEQLLVAPARRLGIEDRIVRAGYRTRDYPDVLACADVLTYLAPGSDGGCRALLEAAACGLPAVVTRRGALAEIVLDGETGLVIEEDAGALAAAWSALSLDPGRRAKLGEVARRRALSAFRPDRRADAVDRLYREALAAL